MIESLKEMFKWFALLNPSVKTMVVLLAIVIFFGYKEYDATKSEKKVLKDTIDNERSKLEICEEDRKTLYNYLIDFEYKDKRIDSLKKF